MFSLLFECVTFSLCFLNLSVCVNSFKILSSFCSLVQRIASTCFFCHVSPVQVFVIFFLPIILFFLHLCRPSFEPWQEWHIYVKQEVKERSFSGILTNMSRITCDMESYSGSLQSPSINYLPFNPGSGHSGSNLTVEAQNFLSPSSPRGIPWLYPTDEET